MNLEEVLKPEQVFCRIQVASKKKALEDSAGLIADNLPRSSKEDIFEHLIAREKLGTTALGHGIAIPHCRLPELREIVCALITLQEPVDFGAFDNEGVQIVFVLLVPEAETDRHLAVLASIAELAESATYRESLLKANDAQSLYQHAVTPPGADVKTA